LVDFDSGPLTGVLVYMTYHVTYHVRRHQPIIDRQGLGSED